MARDKLNAMWASRTAQELSEGVQLMISSFRQGDQPKNLLQKFNVERGEISVQRQKR